MPLKDSVPPRITWGTERHHNQPQWTGRAGSLAPEHSTFPDSKGQAWGPHSTTPVKGPRNSLRRRDKNYHPLSQMRSRDSEARWDLSQFHRCWMVEPGPKHDIPTRTFAKLSLGNNQTFRFWFMLSHGSLAGLASSQAWCHEFSGSPQALPSGGTIGRGARGSCPEKSQSWKQGCLHRLYTLNSRWLLSKQMSYLIIGG